MTDSASPTDAENPYRSPAPVDDDVQRPLVACSFCGKPADQTGPLVEAPQQRAYICLECARVSQATIEKHSRTSPVWGLLGAGLFLVAAIGWLAWSAYFDFGDDSLFLFFIVLAIAWFAVTRSIALIRRFLGRKNG